MRGKTILLKAYADWRVGATRAEKFAYRTADSILLTFDAYGSSEQIERLLAIFKQERVRTVFFLQGDWADANPELVARITQAGHAVANHTYSHPDLLSLSDTEISDQIARGPKSTWFRPPQGRYNARIRRLAQALGYRICYWSIDSDDWQGLAAADMSRKILAELHPGAVVLFHAHAAHTAELLPGLIADIRRQGYELCAPDEPIWSTK